MSEDHDNKAFFRLFAAILSATTIMLWGVYLLPAIDASQLLLFNVFATGLAFISILEFSYYEIKDRRQSESTSTLTAEYPAIGKHIVVTPITDVSTDEKKVYITIDVPNGDEQIHSFQYPHVWDVNGEDGQSEFPAFADELGYDEYDFLEMEGEPVPVGRDKEDSEGVGEFNVLLKNSPERAMEITIENGQRQFIQDEALKHRYGIDVPESKSSKGEIVDNSSIVSTETI